jgi:putative nucleotidyltransferase with HDIG domain
MIYTALLLLTGKSFSEWTVPFQLTLCLLSVLIVFISTTGFVAAGMSIDLQQPFLQIWKERYSWLASFYAGMGFIAYALIFGYSFSYIMGSILMIVPLLLIRLSQKQYIDRTKDMVSQLREKNISLEKKSEEILQLNEGLLETLADIIDLRDPYVLGHSKNVTAYAVQISRKMELHENQIELIRKASLLHDIGKLGVPMEILSKPARLTQDEYDIIKTHAAVGAELIQKSPSLRPLMPIIRHHHEYYDGRGYPDKLKGNAISLEARIVAVADAIEAMSSDRPYRKALEPSRVIDELRKHAGTQFDPRITKFAIEILEAQIRVLDIVEENPVLIASLSTSPSVQVS